MRKRRTTAEGVGDAYGYLLMGLFLAIMFVASSIGYIIYLVKTPWRFKLYKKYKIYVTRVKVLKIISFILVLVSSILTLIITNDRDIKIHFENYDNFVLLVIGSFMFISLVFLKFATQITKKERGEIKQIKKFNLDFITMIKAKEPIMQQAVSMYTRNSDKYNSILESEFNDIIEKIKNQFEFSSKIMDIIKTDTMQQLKAI